MSNEYLLLKWGTLKGWSVKTAASKAALTRYAEMGMSHSAMAQSDDPEQRAALCDLIDAIDGPITDDWSGEDMTKDEAKKYVMEYGQ